MTTFSENLMLFGHSEVHFWSYEGSENGKLQKLVLKAITKRNALAGTKCQLLVKTLMFFGNSEVHFCHMRVAEMVN